jgi:polyisoprenoid-binding protein YceI
MKYLALTALLFCPFSTAVDWQSDPSKSELTYAVNFEQLPLNGQFKDFVVNYSHQQQLRVVVNISSVDMGNSDINEAIRDSDWFDIRQHRQAEFFSDTINTLGEDQYTAQGMLQLKGISKPVTVPFSWNPAKTKTNSATMAGKLTLSRSEFAIGSPEWASGDQIGIDVDVSFSVEMLNAPN